MWVYIHTCSNVICLTIIKMLTAYSANLISCHLLSKIFAEYIMCSHLLYQQCSEQDHLRTSQRTFRTYRHTFPQSVTYGVGWSAARINANWNVYLFVLWLSAWFVINNFDTFWHCYYYSLMSSYVCIDPGAYMICGSIYSFKIGVTTTWPTHKRHNLLLLQQFRMKWKKLARLILSLQSVAWC